MVYVDPCNTVLSNSHLTGFDEVAHSFFICPQCLCVWHACCATFVGSSYEAPEVDFDDFACPWCA